MTNDLKIRNMVVSVEFADKVDLSKAASHFENTEYEPEQFPGLVFKVKNPKASVLIFSSGKMNCTGATSLEETKRVINIVLRKLRSIGVKTKKPKIVVQNMVSTASLGKRINLDKLLQLENTEYEPEQFPGLVLRLKSPKVAFLIFSSGKIVLTGARDLKTANIAFRELKRRLKKIKVL